jgi:membrane associated rhomboid family serine protease
MLLNTRGERQSFFPHFLSLPAALPCRLMEAERQTKNDADAEDYARIAARSQRQAMDWSLVLASQDIHPIIAGPQDAPEQRHEWALLVAPEQYQAALAAIRQYRLENRGWGWRTALPGSGLEIHSGALFWCMMLVALHWIVSFIAPNLRGQGQMSSIAVENSDWYRLFTAVVLHSDLAHLLANVTFGAVFLGLAMARFGWGITLLATFLTGALGNVLGYILYNEPYHGVGASGMMMGALGLLCIHSFGLWRKNPKAARYILSGVIAGFLLFVLFGFSPGSDIFAHLGGFMAGLVFGAILSLASEKKLHNPRLNLPAFLAVLTIMAVTWVLALR